MAASLPVVPRVRLPGGVIRAIAPDSIGATFGLEPGDRIVSINGHRLRDIIDYQYYGSEEILDVVALKGSEERYLRIERTYGEELGFEFEDVLFTSIRRCANTCDFCFVEQNPQGLRSSLYIPDDDYRLSFLFGDFITLTNLKEADWQRIAEQHLTPLYVSVHATDVELRRRLLGNKRAVDIQDEIKKLGAMGIQVHCQIVLCPGINDGPHLEKTVTDVMALYPVVQTVAVVPVGLTKFSPASDVRSVTPAEARALVDQGSAWRRRYTKLLGYNPVLLSDEVYLLADVPVPGAAYYSGFPQYENGIGMIRTWRDDLARLERRLRKSPPSPNPERPRHVTAVCGALAAGVLRDASAVVERMAGVRLDIVEIANDFLGHQVTCSGLLAGRDIRRQLAGRDLGDLLLLPRRALNQQGTLFIDDTSFEEFAQAMHLPVGTGSDVADIAQALLLV